MKMSSKNILFLKNRLMPAIIISLICFLSAIWICGFNFFKVIELKTIDMRFYLSNYMNKYVPDKRIVIIAIDDETEKRMSELSVPRIFWIPYIADSVEQILKDDDVIVVFDTLQTFSTDKYFVEFFNNLQKSMVKKNIINKKVSLKEFTPKWDLRLAQAITGKNVVLSSYIDDVDKKWKKPIGQLSYAVEEDSIGHANLNSDPDGFIRSISLYLTDNEGSNHMNIDLLSASKYLKKDVNFKHGNYFLGNNIIKTDNDYNYYICYTGKSPSFTTIPLWMVFDKTQKNVREFFKKNFSNKIVLIGSTVPADLDIKKTPFGQMPGVEVHANAINSIINNFYLINIKKQYNSIFTFVVCFLISFFLFTQKGTSGQKISLLVILFFVLFAIYLFTIKDLIVNMTMPVVGGILSYIVSFLYKYSIEDREKEKVRKLFERYVSTPVVNKILEDPRSIKLGGHETKVSILFSDINGFTALSEELSPAEVIQLLNEYFELMIESVFKHHGTLKQFVGDEIMAIYGAPYVLENSSLQAAYTSLDMMKKLNVWKEKKKTEGKRCFDIKIGLNCGNVICGNVGSEKRTEYAAVGDVVNTASRIMNLYSTVKPVTGILASKDFYEEIREKINCRYLGAFPVKGKNSIIDIYELLSEKEL